MPGPPRTLSAALVTLTTANGGIVVSAPTSGQGIAVLPALVTAGMTGQTTLYFAVRLYLPGGQVFDCAAGTLTVIQQAVQATSA